MHHPTRTARTWVLLAAAASLSGCMATKFDTAITGYTCCNLRANAGWISSDNAQSGNLVPAGEPVKLESIKKKYYVYGTVGNGDYAFRDDAAKTESDTMQWIHRIIVKEDPRVQWAQWPAEVKTAVSVARVSVGMSREQVAMSIGYPSPNDTRDLASLIWRYWTGADDKPVDLLFTAEGKLAKLEGSEVALRSLEFQR